MTLFLWVWLELFPLHRDLPCLSQPSSSFTLSWSFCFPLYFLCPLKYHAIFKNTIHWDIKFSLSFFLSIYYNCMHYFMWNAFLLQPDHVWSPRNSSFSPDFLPFCLPQLPTQFYQDSVKFNKFIIEE